MTYKVGTHIKIKSQERMQFEEDVKSAAFLMLLAATICALLCLNSSY